MKRLLATVFLLAISFTPAQAKEEQITDLIAQKNLEMKKVLNQDKRTLSAINYLHKHISDDARFRLTVNNPVLPIDSKQTFEMNKEAYINTYIQGTNYIDDYEFDIDTVSVKMDLESAEAITEDILVERGEMLNPYNLEAPGKQFVSRTRCTTRHKVIDGELVSKGGSCHTDVSFEEEI